MPATRPKPKDRRLVEILALVEKTRDGLSVADICDILRIETATANRDLSALRALGIQIHSTKGKCRLENVVTPELYATLLEKYLYAMIHTIGFPQNIRFMVRKHQSYSLFVFSTLVNAIESQHRVEIEYVKYATGMKITRTLEPYEIVPSHRDWRIVGRVPGDYKIYFIQNITSARPLTERFERRKDYDKVELYKNAVNFYRGKETIRVTLAIDPSIAPLVLDELMVEPGEASTDDRNRTVVTRTVSSSRELVKLVMGHGDLIEVVSPAEIRSEIAATAQRLVSLYDAGS
jgi:predicted DNA-binding transcriptional regulator YafY